MRAILLIAIWSAGLADGANILAFFPFGGTSHHILFKPWIIALCERGHSITYLSPKQYEENVTNLEKIPFPDTWPQHISAASKEWVDSYVPDSIFRTYGYLYDAMSRVSKDALESPAVKTIMLSKRRYDAVITEAYFYSEWTSVVAHRFQALHIVIQTFGDYAWANEMSGLPDNPSYQIDHQFHKAEIPSGLLDRLYSFWATVSTVGAGYYFTIAQQEIVDAFFRYPGCESRPQLSLLASDVALILRNTHHSMGDPVPAAPHVKDIGGLNIEFNDSKKTNVLDSSEYKEFKDFMDNTENGFVYFSMGTQVKPSLLPNGTFEVLYSALSKLNVNILMRWISRNGSSVSTFPNVKLYSGFLPQKEILSHKNIRLFITHGGLLGMSEAIYYGVPILGLPIFSDQPMNVMRAANQGYGLYIRNIRNHLVTEKEVIEAANELLKNPKYKIEAQKRSKLFKDRIMTPVDEAVYWTEYVINHGKILQPAAARMPFYQLYLMDIIALVSTFLVISVLLVSLSAKAAYQAVLDFRLRLIKKHK